MSTAYTGVKVDISLEEEQIFRQEMQNVIPIQSAQANIQVKASQQNQLTKKLRRQALESQLEEETNPLSDNEYVELLHPYDELSFYRQGVQEGVLRKLRLGHYHLDAKLHIQHLSVQQARRQLYTFIQEGLQLELRTLLIVHGRGQHIQDRRALLKSYLAKWLTEIPQVLAFYSAQMHHGGTGATYVLLRKSRRQSEANRQIFNRGRL